MTDPRFYRLNCLIDSELGDRLAERAAKSKLAKVAVVTMALKSYFDQQDAIEALMEQITADPNKLAQVCKTLGIVPPSDC